MNIYISNLSYDVTDADLKELFDDYGTVTSAKVIMDRYTGKSRGFGFVEMNGDEESRKAITALDKAEYDGKVISVNEAKPREDKPRGGGGFGGNRGGGGGYSGGGRSGGGGGYSGGGNRSGGGGGYNSERRSSNRY